MIKLTPLFSGSRGNCTLVQTPNTNILIDAGYGFRAIQARLAQSNLKVTDISAIVVTHEHSDHISALPQFAKYSPAVVYVPNAALNYIAEHCLCTNIQGVDGAFSLADVQIDIFRCSHDARACLGYRFTTGDDSVASVTDTGVVSDELVQFLSPCRTVVLESNHDVAMLNNGPYPIYLKRRILSDMGHLSNNQCAEILQKLAFKRVKNVILAHLSQQNNTAQLAMDTATRALADKVTVGKDIALYVADQYQNGITV